MSLASTQVSTLGSLVSTSNPLPVMVSPATSAGTSLKVSTVTFGRTADTNAYAAGDVIGINAAGSPGSAIHTFSSVGPSGGKVFVRSADLTINSTTVIAGMTTFRLHLYTASPTAILDNAAFDLVSGDIATHVGFLDLGTVVDYGSMIYTQVMNANVPVALAASSTTLYGELVTVGGFTPASGTTFQIRLALEAV